MSIEIKLTDKEAEAYLLGNPKIAELKAYIVTAKNYINALEKKLGIKQSDNSETHTPVKPVEDVPERIKQASILLDDIAKESNKPAAPIKPRWTARELALIDWRMQRPEDELNRRFDNLVFSLNRSRSAVRGKLNELGISVKRGILYYTKDL